ncbi:cupin domain-containing protein [Amycolatopsis alkalitolerans]|uniref:Cupin domain-containing protein n=1 Tax=Amycolatopsis alkalitolerans TaxID=2547244 RepID=A0A5C4M3T2_9PSEU|nr:cupin domain-containing protein [Amycolatopsis alkalitolerans]TNC25775.1 cupin domain-containing protein [Amycolatopsis alkalitolerans]
MSQTRIRDYRVSRGLTVRELATRAGVSSGLISQVERGIADPSLETMRKIARVLEIPLFSLFQDEEPSKVAVIRRGDRATIGSPHSTITYSRASRGGSRLEVLEALLEPGSVSATEPRGHPSEECVVALSGCLVVEVMGERHELAEGDSCHFDSNLPHRFLNESGEPTRFLVSVTPPSY